MAAPKKQPAADAAGMAPAAGKPEKAPAAEKTLFKWKCLEKCYVGGKLYYPGDIVDTLPDAKEYFAPV